MECINEIIFKIIENEIKNMNNENYHSSGDIIIKDKFNIIKKQFFPEIIFTKFNDYIIFSNFNKNTILFEYNNQFIYILLEEYDINSTIINIEKFENYDYAIKYYNKY